MTSLPDGWTLATLADVAVPRKLKTAPEGLGALPFIGMDGIEAHTSRLLETVPASTMKSSVALFYTDDVLYGRLRPYLNKVYRADFDGAASAEFIVMQSTAAIDPGFLHHLLMRPEFVSFASQINKGDRPRVDFEEISEFEFALPPIEEQRRIVARLRSLKSRIRQSQDELAYIPKLAERYRQAVLEDAFSGELTSSWREANAEVAPASEFRKLRHQWAANRAQQAGVGRDERNAFLGRDVQLQHAIAEQASEEPLPEQWEWCGIGEVFGVYVGATPSRSNPAYWNGEVPWVSSGEVAFCRIGKTAETITAEGLANASTRLHPPGTVLLGMIGEGKTRGQAAILELEACNNQNCAAIRVSEAGYPEEYVYWYLYAVYERTRTAGAGNNQAALNKEKVQRLVLPLAPLEEAKIVVATIEEQFAPLHRMENEVQSALKQLGHLEKRLLAKAFRGELVPQDPNDEPADDLLERVRATRNATQPSRRGRRRRAEQPALV